MIFYALYSAFSIWMIVDAIRRRVEYYWFLVILFAAPVGPFIYFFIVKIHDFNIARLTQGESTAPHLDLRELRQRVMETPSVANRLELADALHAKESYGEAVQIYEQVLSRDPNDRQALHGLGRCQLGLGKAADAVQSLWKLAEIDNAYRDYSGILDLAEALWQDDKKEETVELLEELVKSSTRINHRVALAHYQIGAGRDGDARDVLEGALGEYERSPGFVQRRDRKWATRAEKMLRQLR